MKITYDPEADALYIELRYVPARDSIDIEEGVTADLDADGHIVGLEILDASTRLTPEELANIQYENLLLTSEPDIEAASRSR
jgi:uncharacterized protein YuzE